MYIERDTEREKGICIHYSIMYISHEYMNKHCCILHTLTVDESVHQLAQNFHAACGIRDIRCFVQGSCGVETSNLSSTPKLCDKLLDMCIYV